MHRASQWRVVRAPGLKISPHPQYHQSRRDLIRAVPGGGRRVQRGDERPPLPLLGALSEQLLELVHHQHHAPLPELITLYCPATVRIPGRPGWPGQGGLAGGEREPGRSTLQLAPHHRRVRPGQHPHPQRQLI